MAIDRYGDQTDEQLDVDQWRLSHRSDEGYPINPAYGAGSDAVQPLFGQRAGAGEVHDAIVAAARRPGEGAGNLHVRAGAAAFGAAVFSGSMRADSGQRFQPGR